MLKDRENGIDHRGIPSSLSGSRYTPSLRTRVAIERGNAHREGDAIHRRCVRVSLSRSPLSLSMASPRFTFGRIFRPVPISPTLNLPISATLNIARKGYPFEYFSSRDREGSCCYRCLRVSLSRSPLSLSMASPRFTFGRIFRPVPISPTLNLPISATLNIARKGVPFEYFSSRDREGSCCYRCLRVSLSRSPLSLSMASPRFTFGRIFRPVPISPTLNLPISATLNIARKGVPFEYFSSRDREGSCCYRCLRVSLSRSPLSLSMTSLIFTFG